MYSNILFLLILILPIPILVYDLRKGINPYRAVLEGAVLAGIGVAVVFIVAQMTGNSIGEEVDKTIESMAKILANNDQMAKATGLTDANRADRIAAYESLYSKGAQILPSVLLIASIIVSYIEGLILSHVIRINKVSVNPMPHLRELTLPKNTIMGWFVIFIASWIMKVMGAGSGDMILANVNTLFEFTFALQGMSLLLLVSHLKKVPKAIPIIVLVVLWLTSIGQSLMFITGILDLIIDLRKRVSAR